MPAMRSGCPLLISSVLLIPSFLQLAGDLASPCKGADVKLQWILGLFKTSRFLQKARRRPFDQPFALRSRAKDAEQRGRAAGEHTVASQGSSSDPCSKQSGPTQRSRSSRWAGGSRKANRASQPPRQLSALQQLLLVLDGRPATFHLLCRRLQKCASHSPNSVSEALPNLRSSHLLVLLSLASSRSVLLPLRAGLAATAPPASFHAVALVLNNNDCYLRTSFAAAPSIHCSQAAPVRHWQSYQAEHHYSYTV